MKFLLFFTVILLSIPLQAQVSKEEIRDSLEIDKELKNWTPLHFFVVHGLTMQIAEELKKKNIDLNAKDIYGWTALHYSGLRGSMQIINTLIIHGADPHIKTQRGYTLFHIFISAIPFQESKEESQKRLLTLLIYYKLDINAKDDKGNTPLHLAVSPSELSLDIIHLLVKNRADINARNHQGLTPLHFIALYGSIPVAEYFIQAGANIHAKNDEGKTPLDLAKIVRNKKMILFLENQITRVTRFF